MYRRTQTPRWQRAATLAALTTACALNAQAQPAAVATDGVTLRQAFDAAWARQPEALALQARVKKNWVPQMESGKSGKAEVTRLDRDTLAAPGKASKTEGREIKFHGIPGQFWT
ncbi:MAG: hypothetical protein H7Y61_04485, partial [Rhizobiales bacterium]|nr:hypothetical protein [Rhizobacter sp.]